MQSLSIWGVLDIPWSRSFRCWQLGPKDHFGLFLGVLIHLVGSLITRDPGDGSLAWGDNNYKRCGGNGHLRSFSRAYLSSLLRSCWLRGFLFLEEVCP